MTNPDDAITPRVRSIIAATRARKPRLLGRDGDAAADGMRCWLCERPLGLVAERHHPVPRSRGGRITVRLHPICHRTVHAALANAELARIGEDLERLRADAAIARFLAWIADKPADFNAPTRRRPS